MVLYLGKYGFTITMGDFNKPKIVTVEIPMVIVEFETPQLHQDWA
jgi:hypothetical protein